MRPSISKVFEENGSLLSFHYESILDFIDFYDCKEFVTESKNSTTWKQIIKRGNSAYWYGVTNPKSSDVVNHSLVGDSHIYEKKIKPLTEQLNKVSGFYSKDYENQVQIRKRKRTRKDFGDELDIHAVYQGNLKTAWNSTKRIEFDQKTKFINLFLQINGTSDIDVDSSYWNAAVCIKLIDEIEKTGKNVQFTVGGIVDDAFSNSRKATTFSINVKKYNERLSVERLAAMTHLGFYRVFGFLGRAVNDDLICSYGMGSSRGTLTPNVNPIQIQKEIDKGHTKIIRVNRSLNITQASLNLKDAFGQIKNI